MKKRKILLALCILFLLAAGLRYYNTSVDCLEVAVTVAGLPEAFDGLRILLLTDLHGRQIGENSKTLLRLAAETQPDLIALCGDMLDEAEQLPTLVTLAQGLTELAPVFYVTGNHEWAARCVGETVAALEECGVVCLRNDFVTLTREGQRLILAGTEDPNGPADMCTPEELVQQIRAQAPDDCVVLLNHRNEPPQTWQALGVQVVLSGHAHGGVIRLPFVGGLLDTDRSLFPAYDAGLYRSGQTALYVSRGLGGVRLLCRPELPVIVLKK